MKKQRGRSLIDLFILAAIVTVLMDACRDETINAVSPEPIAEPSTIEQFIDDDCEEKYGKFACQ